MVHKTCNTEEKITDWAHPRIMTIIQKMHFLKLILAFAGVLHLHTIGNRKFSSCWGRLFLAERREGPPT